MRNSGIVVSSATTGGHPVATRCKNRYKPPPSLRPSYRLERHHATSPQILCSNQQCNSANPATSLPSIDAAFAGSAMIAAPAGAAPAAPKPPTVKLRILPVLLQSHLDRHGDADFAEGRPWRFLSRRIPVLRLERARHDYRDLGLQQEQELRTAPYPDPTSACRVGRFGTEDRAAHKGGSYFDMSTDRPSVQLRVQGHIDRHIASLTWSEEPPVFVPPFAWGWYIDGKWAGHDATRAFEVQSKACKLMTVPVRPPTLPVSP